MEEDKPHLTKRQNTIKNAVVLAVFAMVSISATAITWVATRDRIQSEKEEALLRAIDDLIPQEIFANDPYTDCILVTAPQYLGSQDPRQVWRLRDSENQPVGLIISSIAPNGYTGPIEFIAGYRLYSDMDDRLSGVRVTTHQETPGLGDKIDARKSDWIFTLSDHNVTDVEEPKWLVKNDGGEFDAFTGATITPRALLAAITRTTDYYRMNKAALFNTPSNCSDAAEKSYE